MNTANSGRTRRCKNNIRQLAGLDDCFDGSLLSTASVFILNSVNTSTIMSTINLSIWLYLRGGEEKGFALSPPRCDLRLIHCYAVGIPWHELQQLPRTVPGRRVARSLWLPFTWS
ncbi:unnamed protein product, partial [Timema podura]|nr:unnamed protein product [Timema podura]